MSKNNAQDHPSSDILCPIAQGARQFPNSPALWLEDRAWTYQDLENMVGSEARRLREFAGKTVAVVEWNSPVLVASLFALWRLQSLVLLLNPRLPRRAQEQAVKSIGAKRLNLSRAQELVGSALSLPATKDLTIGPLLHPTALATAMLTSGSSGAPKTIVHSIQNHYVSANQCLERLKIGLGSIWLLSLPCFHVGGLAILWRSFVSGAAVRILPPNTTLAHQIATDPPSILSVVPTQLSDLITTKRPCPIGIKDVIVGGAPISRQLLDAALKLGYPIRTTYGATETASMVTLSERWTRPVQAVHAGKPLPGNTLSVGHNDRLRMQSKALYAGTFQEQKFVPRPESVFETQDRATILPTGEVQILSRADDVIITGGENVSLIAIEKAILEHPRVLACRVIAIEHARYGMQPIAFIQQSGPEPETEPLTRFHDGKAKPETKPSSAKQKSILSPVSDSSWDLQKHLTTRLPSFAIPKIMLPMPVPKAGALKITHKQLLEIATRKINQP